MFDMTMCQVRTMRRLAQELQDFQEIDQLRVLGAQEIHAAREDTESVDIGIIDRFHDIKLTSDEIADEQNETHDNDNAQIESDDSLGPLPPDLFDLILTFVGENYFDTLLEANPRWQQRVNSEFVWRQICLSTFVRPAFKPINKANRKSWRHIGLNRARVKFSGVYIHRHRYIRDRGPASMWSVGSKRYLEISHYRYIMFLSNGTVLYASTPLEPEIILPRIYSKLLNLKENYIETEEQDSRHNKRSKRIFLGHYAVTGKNLCFVVDLEDYSVKFTFQIDDVNTITAVRHESLLHIFTKQAGRGVSSGAFLNNDEVITHPLTSLYRFERQWTFHVLF